MPHPPNAVAAITRQAKSMFNEIKAYILSDKCASLPDVRNWDKEDQAPLNLSLNL
jgi:hypothetical protein